MVMRGWWWWQWTRWWCGRGYQVPSTTDCVPNAKSQKKNRVHSNGLSLTISGFSEISGKPTFDKYDLDTWDIKCLFYSTFFILVSKIGHLVLHDGNMVKIRQKSEGSQKHIKIIKSRFPIWQIKKSQNLIGCVQIWFWGIGILTEPNTISKLILGKSRYPLSHFSWNKKKRVSLIVYTS